MAWNGLKALARAEENSLPDDPEPRWPAVVAALAAAGLYTGLPEALTPGPTWLFPTIVIGLLIPNVISHHAGRHQLNTVFGIAVNAALTLGLTMSVFLLIITLPTGIETPQQLLFSAACLWTTNILIFALWYWRLDAGGPHERDKRLRYMGGAFLFPQLTVTEGFSREAGQENWSPEFVDYLFLSFNTNTAFSPTDSPVLARWAKIFMMLQSLLSLLIIAVLAARAVNMV
jgi:uncharacterized membrane protein